MTTKAIRIFGIDPGLRSTGWGVVEIEGNQLKWIDSGVVSTDSKQAIAPRLQRIYDGLEQAIERLHPDEGAVENTFVSRAPEAALKLGHARGVALLALARGGILPAEYAPNAIKKAVVGVGHGAKEQVQMMVKILLPKARFQSEHDADALAVAICHAHSKGRCPLTPQGD